MARRAMDSRSGPSRISPAGARFPPQDDQLGVEQVVEVGRGQPDVPPRVGDDPAATGILAWASVMTSAMDSSRPWLRPQVLRDGGGVGQRVEAAPATALADLTVLVDRGVAEFPGGAVRPGVQGSVEDEADADAGGGVDVGDVLQPARRTPRGLRDGGQVGVVVDGERQPQRFGGGDVGIDVDPRLEAWSPGLCARCPADRPRDRDPDPEHTRGAARRAAVSMSSPHHDQGLLRLCTLVDRDLPMREQPPGDVADRRPHHSVGDLHPHRHPGAGDSGTAVARAAPRPGRALHLGDHPRADEFVDDRGDGRPGEPDAGQFPARERIRARAGRG